MRRSWLIALASSLPLHLASGFGGAAVHSGFTRASERQGVPSTRTLGGSSTSLQCICIDCKWVTSCKAYHFVETKHEQPHMTNDPTFTPKDGSPTIHVNVRTIRTEEQKEAQKRMLKEHAAETQRAEEKQAAMASETEQPTDDALHGETVYDLSPVTTYEYDVVACEDYVEDKGCWIRNMPEEIRLANPDFVPT